MATPRSHVPDRWIGPDEAARILHVASKTLSRWAKDGRIAHQRTLGGHRRYSELDIRALADRLRYPATTDWRDR